MNTANALGLAHRWFWALTIAAIALTGAISAELNSPPRPSIGVAVAFTGALLALAIIQACRIMLAISRVAPTRNERTAFRKAPDRRARS